MVNKEVRSASTGTRRALLYRGRDRQPGMIRSGSPAGGARRATKQPSPAPRGSPRERRPFPGSQTSSDIFTPLVRMFTGREGRWIAARAFRRAVPRQAEIPGRSGKCGALRSLFSRYRSFPRGFLSMCYPLLIHSTPHKTSFFNPLCLWLSG